MLIDIQKANFTVPQLAQPIIKHLTYQIYERDFMIILGGNGSGKSSLIKMMDKRYSLSSGDIILENRSIRKYGQKKFYRTVKTLTQNPEDSLFSSLSILENFLILKQQYNPNFLRIRDQKERELLAEYLSPFNQKLAGSLDATVNSLSGGEKQALALALTVFYPPKVLLLDEHTSALDPKTARVIMELTQKTVEKFHITCILTTHDLDIAEKYGNRLLALKNGEIYRQYDGHDKTQVGKTELLAACY